MGASLFADAVRRLLIRSRHLAYMLEDSITTRAESIYFNSLASPASVLDWLEEGGYVSQDKARVV